jgi:uncharacterized protein (TIGR03083 family)
MTDGIIEALQEEREVVLGICAGLGEADWAAESGCPGWSVRDVISHLGAGYWMVADPASRPAGGDLPFERAQDAHVAARRHLSAAQAVVDYADISTKAIEILAGLLGSGNEVPLGDLGTYPAGILPNAFCFDHYAHTRLDLFPPRGPLTGEPPPAGTRTFGAALDWAQAALPQQNGKVLAELAGPVAAVITGPAARTIQIGPPGDPVASITSDAGAFLRWVTLRATPEEAGAEVSGDPGQLAIARELHVF